MEQAMIPTYKAILRGNRLEWRGDSRRHIPADRAMMVHVTLVDEHPIEPDGIAGKQQGAAMAAALTRLAELDALSDIVDAAAWEREMRQDRELPGRSEDISGELQACRSSTLSRPASEPSWLIAPH